MDQFGVKKPSLKKIARTPQLPRCQLRKAIAKPQAKESPSAATASLRLSGSGRALQTLDGEEFSAYGVE